MVNAGGIWLDERSCATVLITSREPADLPAFMRTIVGALQEARLPATNGAR